MSDEEVVTQEMVDEELHACARYGELDDLKAMVASDDTGMVNFNAVDAQGNSALHKAAANDHMDMLKYLVENKANYILNNNRVGPITWAIINKQLNATKYLLDTFSDQIDVLDKPDVGLSALSTAYDVDASEVIKCGSSYDDCGECAPFWRLSNTDTHSHAPFPQIVSLLLTHKSAHSLDSMADKQVEADEGDDELGEETTQEEADAAEAMREMEM